MRTILMILVAATVGGAGSPAVAQAPDDGYAPFEVTRSPVRRGHEITAFELAGESVALNAYGRKARARQFDASEALKEQRAMGEVFEDAPQPSLVTIEARLSF